MKLVEHVPGELLVLEVGSRSRPGRVNHYLSVVYDEEGDVADVSCSCEAFCYRRRCHHVLDAEDLAGRGAP